jgi:hypothetical protein
MIINRKGMPWTEDEDTILKELFDSGLSCSYIAAYFGRTTAAITTRLVRHGLLIYVNRKGTYHKIVQEPWA